MSHSRIQRSSFGGEPSNWTAAFLYIMAVAAVFGIGWFIWQYSCSQQIALPVSVGAAFDASGSMSKDEKRRAVGVLYTLVDEVLPLRTPLRIWVYAEQIHESVEKQPRRSSDLNSFATSCIVNRLGEWGTYQHLALQAMLDYARRRPERVIVLCLFTDGEDHTPPSEIRRLAQEIATLPNVCAVIVGPLEDRLRMNYRSQLEPLEASDKLILFGLGDAEYATSKLKEKLSYRSKEVQR